MPTAAAVKIGAQLRKVQAVETKKMIEAIREARVRVSANVRRAAKAKGMATSRLKREGLYKQASAFYGELAEGLDRQMEELVMGVSKLGFEDAAADLKSKTGKIGARYSTDYARNIWETIHPANGDSIAGVFTDKMAEADIRALRTAFINTYRQASLEGWTASKISANFRKAWMEAAGGIEEGKFIDAAGRQWSDQAYAEMLTRTTIGRTYRESFQAAVVESGHDLQMIENVGDTCEFCQAWDGIIVSITGNTPNYPTYAEAVACGFGHPNCDCLMTYVDETVDEKKLSEQADVDNPEIATEGTPSENRRANLAAIQNYREKITGEKTDAQLEKERKAKSA